MARQPATRLQVSGYRFLVRRMEHALLRGDIRMLHDPMRAQSHSWIAGCILAVIAVAGCAILALVRPQGILGSAPIVMTRESGALYVRVGDTAHPVLNLASARLIAGTAANPEIVRESEVHKAKRGPALGIPGAPAVIASPLTADESAWTVCDTGPAEATVTAVITGPVEGHRLSRSSGVLVTPRWESAATTYLLYDGWRAEVDLRNPAVVRALRLDGVAPRPISRALLDAIPEAPSIAPPHIPDAGAAGPVAGLPVGTVVRMARADATEHYVVLARGVQRVGEVAADLIRFTSSLGNREIRTVAPDVIGRLPAVDVLPVSTFPERAGAPPDTAVLCAHWQPNETAGQANTTVLVGGSLPVDSTVSLAQADGAGPNVDNMRVPHGRSAYVRSTGVTGGGEGSLYLITDSGVLFGIHDEDAAKVLGLSAPAVPAPWPVLALLPRGPELSIQAASVAHDTIAAAPAG
jgi:type VII secretion protein EccB